MKKGLKRILTLIVASMMALCFTGCSNNAVEGGSNETNNTIENNIETSGNAEETPISTSDASKVLIVYFSHSNNTHKLTEMLKEEINADVIRLTPAEPYGSDLFERAQDELNSGTRPDITNLPDAETVAQYDTILVGFPIWWYDLPMPVWTFLENYDLSGKTIIPYFTHNGSSNGAGSLDTIEELCPNSNVRSDDALSIAGSNVEGSEAEVKEWISQIGLSK